MKPGEIWKTTITLEVKLEGEFEFEVVYFSMTKGLLDASEDLKSNTLKLKVAP